MVLASGEVIIMDLRTQKTQKAIKNAFIALRMKKPLNKISVTELAKEAMISKATFYLHYKDIYDLSEQLQDKLVLDIVAEIPHPERMYTDSAAYAQGMMTAFDANKALTNILFSEDEKHLIPEKIESYIKNAIYENRPELRGNIGFDIVLSMIINGSFYAYRNYMDKAPEVTAEWIGRIARLLSDYITENIVT